MLFLYHSGPSVCSIKVRLVLAEKNLAWDGKILNLQRGDQFQPDYRKINPNAVVPTLIHNEHLSSPPSLSNISMMHLLVLR